MNRSVRRRLRRARQNTAAAPADLSALTPVERLTWMSDLLGFDKLVRLAQTRPAQAVAETPKAGSEPEPLAEATTAPPTVEAKPEASPRPSKPPEPRNWWEEDPNYVPPPQHSYIEEHCHWRERQADDYYDDEPEPEDEWDS